MRPRAKGRTINIRLLWMVDQRGRHLSYFGDEPLGRVCIEVFCAQAEYLHAAVCGDVLETCILGVVWVSAT